MDKHGKVLLHACCAPCLTQALAVLCGMDQWERALPEAPSGKVGVWFYNPNLEREEEARRETEVYRLLHLEPFSAVHPALVKNIRDREDDRREWREAVRGLESEPEKGARCTVCYTFRLKRAFEAAHMEGYDAVATSLTLSPLKDTARINAIGKELEAGTGIRYLASDFKKNDGFKKSGAISRELGLYRQDWCGCSFSKAESLKRKATKLPDQ